MKKLILAGGTGLVGKTIRTTFESANWKVVTLSRRSGPNTVQWDGKSIGDWQSEIASADCVINLSGRSISTKFTPQNLKDILDSRIETTQVIGEAIVANNPGCHWINASAIGFYGNRGDLILDESSSVGTGILGEICQKWELAVTDFNELKTARVRIGIVLDPKGGALKPLLLLTKLGLGGSAGSGNQYMSWIHCEDLAKLFLWIAENKKVGVYNGTAPNPVTNREFMAVLRENIALAPFKSLYRRLAPPSPEFMLNLIGKIFGPDSQLILNSQRVIPKRAEDEGFEFLHPDLKLAISDLTRP